MSSRGTTHFRLENKEGLIGRGKLVEKKDKVTIPKDWFEQGTQELFVWMEDEDGKHLKEFDWKKTFHIDTVSPELQVEADGGVEGWHKNRASISVHAKEQTSGMNYISCYVNGEKQEVLTKKRGTFVIEKASKGGRGVTVRLEARDRAGNGASWERDFFIDSQAPVATIKGATDYMITSKPVSVVYRVDEDNVLDDCRAFTKYEDTKGNEMTQELLVWEDHRNYKKSVQKLKEDGLYKLNVFAKDGAGFEAHEKMQVIIDKENPVIRYVDDLQGARLKSFEWNYSKEELIEDYTSFDYEILLDGKLYPMGKKITREGKHTLEVGATDQAGNRSYARATFTIDHTPPEFIWEGIKEGERYEGKHEFKIRLKDAEDILRKVQINGEEQRDVEGENGASFSVEKAGDYEVLAEARDLTGNVAEEKIHFTVVKKKSLLEKIIDPVIKPFRGNNDSDKNVKKEGEKEERDQKKEKSLLLRKIAGTMIGILMVGGVLYSTTLIKLARD